MGSNATACSLLMGHACFAWSGQLVISSRATCPRCTAVWQIEHHDLQAHRCSTWLQILL